jgi:hypothetical protein
MLASLIRNTFFQDRATDFQYLTDMAGGSR